AILQFAKLVHGEETHARKISFLPENAVEFDGMADRFVNLKAELRAAQDDRAGFFRTLRGGVKRHSFFAGASGIADKIERFDELLAFESVLAAEAIGIRTLLNFAAGKTGGNDSGAGLHFHLMNHRADGRNENLVDFAEGHRAFGERDAFRAPHFP